jgi:hypothetical protein
VINVECALGCLKPRKKYSGVIVKETNGHRFVTAFTNSLEDIKKIKERLDMVKKKGINIEIIETIESKEREEIQKKIENLNKKGGFTGINIIPEDLSC